MTVIVSNGAVALTTVGGFYRAEAYNVSTNSSTTLALTSAQTFGVTFADAGNCQGVILCLFNLQTSGLDRGVAVTLEELVGAIWTPRATVTLTIAQITASAVPTGNFILPFTGGTFPYPVDTTGGKWRFSVIQTGGTTGTWQLRTSNGTAPFFVTWCDTAATFADNDCVVCKDAVTIDKTATIKAVLGTGDTTYGVAAIVCRSLTLTDAGVCNLKWQNAPGAAYTLTIDGCITVSSHAGIECGTSLLPIPVAKQAYWNFITPTVGTASGIIEVRPGAASNWVGKSYLFFYGDTPTVRATTLSQAEAAGQAKIHTVDATGWVNGDVVAIGRMTAKGTDTTNYVVQGVVGTEVTLTGNLASARSIGAAVLKLSGYGVKVKMPSGGIYQMPNKMVFQGVELCDTQLVAQGSYTYPGYTVDAASVRGAWTYKNCSVYATTAAIYSAIVSLAGLPPEGVTFNGVHAHRVWLVLSAIPLYAGTFTSGPVTITGCVAVNHSVSSSGFIMSMGNLPSGVVMTVTNNTFENSNKEFLALCGVACTFTGNKFWGANCTSTITTGAVYIGPLVSPVAIGGNTYDNCTRAIAFGPYASVNAVDIDSIFGATVANTADIYIDYAAYIDYQFQSPTGALVLTETGLTATIPGTNLRISTFNDAAADHRCYTPYGYFRSTGAGLADTTVHTAGGYALRFQPLSSVSNLTWAFTVPTGNILAKTMYVSVWVKINSATFYATAAHQKPRLTVNYDNGTLAYAEAAASTAWQLLTVPFTPATSYGQITVTLSCRTDATGTDAYVYWDDMGVAYPPNVALDLGAMDNWADALPVTPPIALPLSAGTVAGAVWDALRAGHVIAGSYGATGEWVSSGDTPGTTTLLTRLTAARAGYLDSLAGWTGTIRQALRALATKVAGEASSDLTGGSSTYNLETDSQEAIRDRGDAAWTGDNTAVLNAISALNNLSSAGAQAAAAAALAAYGAAKAGDTMVPSVLPLDPTATQGAAAAALAAYSAATSGDVSGAAAAVLGAVGAISTITADDVLDEPVEGTLTLRQIQRVLLAFAAGQASGGGTTAVAIRDQADTRDRIAMTVDDKGNRTAVVLDVT